MSNKIEHTQRFAWPDDFPDVFNLMTVTERDANPNYLPAKYFKNPKRAEKLMSEVSKTERFKKTISRMQQLGNDITLVPVNSLEHGYDPKLKKPAIGSNPLPLAIALELGDHLNWKINNNIVQSNIVGHTGANCISRFAHPALFSGKVNEGQKYLIIDDHVSLGGTVANCRGHIEQQGGIVVGVGSLTTNRSGACLRLTSHHKNRMLNAENYSTIGCHSPMVEKIFGYSIECLTNSEASQILYILTEVKKKRPQYNLQNFFDELIAHRQSTDTTMLLQKENFSKQKIDGTVKRKHNNIYTHWT